MRNYGKHIVSMTELLPHFSISISDTVLTYDTLDQAQIII